MVSEGVGRGAKVPASSTSVAFRLRRVLVLLCVITAVAAGWLLVMDVLLRHQHLLRSIGISGLIAGEAALILVAMRWAKLRWVALAGTVGTVWLAESALWSALHGGDFEGYVLLICVALLMEAALAWVALPGRREVER